MGIFDDDELDALLEEESGFEPLQLNTHNIQMVFKRCVSKKEPTGTIAGVLFSAVGGYSSKSNDIMYFSVQKLSEDRQNILYLLGQLKCVHSQERKPDIHSLFLDYFSENWTIDNATLLELLYLAGAIRVLAPFEAQNNTTILDLNIIKPTLSPKDPNFPAWWEAHKAEWETAAE